MNSWICRHERREGEEHREEDGKMMERTDDHSEDQRRIRHGD